MTSDVTRKTVTRVLPFPNIYLVSLFLSIFAAESPAHSELERSIQQLKQLPFEELVGQEVTTVSRRSQPLIGAPSAIQVLTAEDIARSGATSVPEALRLAPNLHVAQANSREWAISARGFNSLTANKLLVLIDGRTVYTPLFAGVFWDVQHLMLQDINRIEVISGPGATMWGGNAVNGVINIVSKGAEETQGTLVSGGVGSFLEEFASVRYGTRVGSNVFVRVYGMGFERDSTLLANGHEGTNDWHLAQGGFRTDWLPATGDRLTVQGDLYAGSAQQPEPGDITVNGQNILTRWIHPLADESDFTVKLFWDRTYGHKRTTLAEELNTYEAEFIHRLAPLYRNRFNWGVQYRLLMDDVDSTARLAFEPEEVNLELFSGFVQDEIEVIKDHVFLTLGSKIELNDYSGLELQPSARLAWLPTTNQTIWGAVSRAVRTPSRIDTEVRIPGTAPYLIRGGRGDFESEELLAYELGYRTELSHHVALSVAGFYNDYDDVRSVEPIRGTPGEFVVANELRAKTYGAEFSATYQLLEWWRLRGGYTYLRKHIHFDDSQDLNRGTGEGNDPEHQFLIQSMINLPANVQFDSVLRYVDDLDQRGPLVRAYLTLDMRLAWRPNKNWELALIGQNLLDPQHPEFGERSTRQEIPRNVLGKVTWHF